MRSVTPMKTAKIGYIIISLALCALGILLIVVPKFSAVLLGRCCGMLFLLFGAVKLVGYFSKDLYRLASQHDLTLGILLLILGGIMLTHPGSLMLFICITFGIFMVTDGLMKIQIAEQSRTFGIGKWWLIFASAAVTGTLGFVLLLRPGEGTDLLMTILGIGMLSEGILNLSTAITTVKIIRHQWPDIIENVYCEEKEV